MSGNGHRPTQNDGHAVLHWAGKVLTADDLRTRLNGHRELWISRGTVVTPLAADDLRARGVTIVRREPVAEEKRTSKAVWGIAQDRPNGIVQSAVQAAKRDGLPVGDLHLAGEPCSAAWAKALAECVARGDCQGCVVFCEDAGLLCCVANKLAGLRAASVNNVAQAARAVLTVGANLVAVESFGRTFFELRQILRTVCTTRSACPAAVANVLQELERHANR